MAICKHVTLSSYLFNTSGQLTLCIARIFVAHLPLIVYQTGDGNRFGGYKVKVPICLCLFSAQINFFKCITEFYHTPRLRISMELLGGLEHWKNDIEFIESFEVVCGNLDTLNTGVHISNSPISGGILYTV